MSSPGQSLEEVSFTSGDIQSIYSTAQNDSVSLATWDASETNEA